MLDFESHSNELIPVLPDVYNINKGSSAFIGSGLQVSLTVSIASSRMISVGWRSFTLLVL